MESAVATQHDRFTLTGNARGDRFLAEINAGTFAVEEPNTLFEKHFSNRLGDEQTLYIIIGSDSGLLMSYLAGRPAPRGSRYLFVESEAVQAALETPLDALETESVFVTTAPQWLSRAGQLGLDNYCYRGRVELVHSLGASHSEYTALAQEIGQQLAHHRWKLEIDTGMHLFIRNNIANLADAQRPASVLRNAFDGKTALVMAAGPSLDSLLPWISAQRQRLVLIAVSRVARLLQDKGIEPDMIVTVDPQDISLAISKEIFAFGPGTLLVHSSSAAPAIVGQWRHDKVYTGPQFFWEMSNSPNIPQQGPTVTNEAISLALHLGFSQILLAGVDLCFGREGRSHASGSLEHDRGPLSANSDRSVQTNAGYSAGTNNGYYECIRQIELQLEESPLAARCRVVNLAADAAAIKGVEYLAPDAISLTPQEASEGRMIIRRCLQATPVGAAEHYRQVSRSLARAIDEIAKIRRLAHEALAANQAIAARNDDGIKIKNAKKLDKIEKQLERHHKALADTIKLINARHFARMLASDDGGQMDPSEANERTGIYYQAYLHGARLLLDYLTQARERVLARQEEESAQPDIERLAAQWRKDGQPGRSFKWRQDHPEVDAHLTADQRARLAQLEQDFDSGMVTLERELNAHFTSANVPSYDSLIDKALACHDAGDAEGVRTLLDWIERQAADCVERHYDAIHEQPERLAASPIAQRFIEGRRDGDQPYAESVREVVSGLQHELAGETQQALACYARAEFKPYAPHPGRTALERSVLLATGQERYEEALDALTALAQHIDAYKLTLARMLRELGQPEHAISRYTDYISANPTDLDALLELGLLFADIGARDGVAAVRDNIAAQAPHHPALHQLDDALDNTTAQGVSD